MEMQAFHGGQGRKVSKEYRFELNADGKSSLCRKLNVHNFIIIWSLEVVCMCVTNIISINREDDIKLLSWKKPLQ